MKPRIGPLGMVALLILLAAVAFGAIELVQRRRIANLREDLPKVLTESLTPMRILRGDRGLQPAPPEGNDYGTLELQHSFTSDDRQKHYAFTMSGHAAIRVQAPSSRTYSSP
jgi:hypothetical protein